MYDHMETRQFANASVFERHRVYFLLQEVLDWLLPQTRRPLSSGVALRFTAANIVKRTERRLANIKICIRIVTRPLADVVPLLFSNFSLVSFPVSLAVQRARGQGSRR